MGIGVLNLMSMFVLEKIGIFSDLEKNAGLGNLEKNSVVCVKVLLI